MFPVKSSQHYGMSIQIWLSERTAVALTLSVDPLYTTAAKPYLVYESIGNLDAPLDAPPPHYSQTFETFEEALKVFNARYINRLPSVHLPAAKPVYTDIRKLHLIDGLS